jgi:hypothetical protein
MAFHPEKNVLTITKKRNPTKFSNTLHGHSLEDVTSTKYIGCTITSDLKWGTHIFIHHSKPGVCSSAFERLPFKLIEHITNI